MKSKSVTIKMVNKIKIGVDVDEVLCEHLVGLIEYYKNETGIFVPFENFHTYYWPDVWNVSLERAKEIDYNFKSSKNFEKLAPVFGSKEAVYELSKFFELTVITSRAYIFKDKTINWIKKHFGESFLEVIHSSEVYSSNGLKKTKGQICKEKDIKIHIEDDFSYAKEIADKGIFVLLFDKPWNKSFKESEKIIKIKSWDEALVKIKEITKNGSI